MYLSDIIMSDSRDNYKLYNDRVLNSCELYILLSSKYTGIYIHVFQKAHGINNKKGGAGCNARTLTH